MKKLATIMLAMLLTVSFTGIMVAQDTGGTSKGHKTEKTKKGHKGGKKSKKGSGGTTTPPPK